MVEPIIKEIRVSVPPSRAFEVFTAQMAQWWPLDSHSHSAGSLGKPAQSITIEPVVGGALVEGMHDGTTSQWGTVQTWDPPQTVAFTWHPGRSTEDQTLVTVTFEPVDGGTLVRLVHSGWDNLGTEGGKLHHQYDSGWDQVFGQYFAQAVA